MQLLVAAMHLEGDFLPGLFVADCGPKAVRGADLAAVDAEDHVVELQSGLLGGELLASDPRLDWAKLLRRTYGIDIFQCPECGRSVSPIGAGVLPSTPRSVSAEHMASAYSKSAKSLVLLDISPSA